MSYVGFQIEVSRKRRCSYCLYSRNETGSELWLLPERNTPDWGWNRRYLAGGRLGYVGKGHYQVSVKPPVLKGRVVVCDGKEQYKLRLEPQYCTGEHWDMLERSIIR